MAGITSKAIGVSIKDRSAILPLGRMGDGAYWYDAGQNRWVTSTYYRKELPGWAKAVNDREGFKQYSAAKWLPFEAKGDAAQPFCTMVSGTDVRNCGSLEATPWGNEMIEEFSERALDGEELGKHEGIDVLAVSFSSNDYVGHAVGPDDPAVHDISVRTDRLLGKLLSYVDKKVGRQHAGRAFCRPRRGQRSGSASASSGRAPEWRESDGCDSRCAGQTVRPGEVTKVAPPPCRI